MLSQYHKYRGLTQYSDLGPLAGLKSSESLEEIQVSSSHTHTHKFFFKNFTLGFASSVIVSGWYSILQKHNKWSQTKGVSTDILQNTHTPSGSKVGASGFKLSLMYTSSVKEDG